MAEQEEISDPRTESLTDKISDKIHGDDGGDTSSSSSDSEPEDKKTASEYSVKDKNYRLFGREKPVHKVFGGGKRTYSRAHELLPRLLTILILSYEFSDLFIFLAVLCLGNSCGCFYMCK